MADTSNSDHARPCHTSMDTRSRENKRREETLNLVTERERKSIEKFGGRRHDSESGICDFGNFYEVLFDLMTRISCG